MPPKVSRTSTVRTTPPKKTVSSSKSTNKSSSSSGVKKSALPVTSKPKNVDKVDFGKTKTIASAGTYKPAPPPKPSTAELARIAREEERAAARAQLPGLIKKADNSSAWENSKTVLKGIGIGASTGFSAGKFAASQIPPTDPATTEMLDVVMPMAGAGLGAIKGGNLAAKEVSNEDAIVEAQRQLRNAKDESAICDGVFHKCDRDLMDCLTRATKQGPLPSSIGYPTDMATLRRDFNL